MTLTLDTREGRDTQITQGMFIIMLNEDGRNYLTFTCDRCFYSLASKRLFQTHMYDMC